ncbi:MAG: hypothetical protein HY534_03585 [Chloroflexi bacterium]|nr:hypothetical protein [Chloroflexota bacterium]
MLLSFPSGFFAPLPLVPDPTDSGSRPISEWYALPWIQARFEASGALFIHRNAFAADRACVSVCALFVYAHGFLDEAGALTGLSLSQEYEASSPEFVGLSLVELPPGVPGYSLRLRLPIGAEMLTFGTVQHNLMIGGQVLALSGQNLAAVEARDRALRFILDSIRERSPTR